MRKALVFMIWGMVLALSVFTRLSFVWGSNKFFFSGFCILAPLLGGFFGVLGTGAVLMFTKLLRYVFLGSLAGFTAGVPTLLAAWCWSLDMRPTDGFNPFYRVFLNIVVPLGCFVAFVMHPSSCFFFGLYWFIPVVVYGAQLMGFLNKNLFATALRSTFLAHALGSVLWCYFVPMSPEQWLALIPIVAVERFVFAVGMVALYNAWQAIARKIFNKSIKKTYIKV